jgi:microcystin-dependent protein
MKRLLVSIALASAFACASPRPANAQVTPFIGQVQIFAFNFCPTGWLPLNGQTLQISVNTALFSLLGTLYGGDGVTTFALPNWGHIYATNGGGPMTACMATVGVFPPRS